MPSGKNEADKASAKPTKGQWPRLKGKPKHRSALEKLHPLLDALPREELKPPPLLVDRLVREARALAVTARHYEAELRKVGLERRVISSLDERAHALADAEALLTLLRSNHRSKEEVQLERKAMVLREAMVAEGRFAVRKDADALAALDEIRQGEGVAELMEDLHDLAAFFEAHRAKLEAIGVKAEKRVLRTRRFAAELAQLVQDQHPTDEDEEKARELRDRAVTYLLEGLQEVRAAGAYVFRKKPVALARFRSPYATGRHAPFPPKGVHEMAESAEPPQGIPAGSVDGG